MIVDNDMENMIMEAIQRGFESDEATSESVAADVLNILGSSTGVKSEQTSSRWECDECQCKTFAYIHERQADGSYAPGRHRRCVNCKKVHPPRFIAVDEAFNDLDLLCRQLHDIAMGRDHLDGFMRGKQELQRRLSEFVGAIDDANGLVWKLQYYRKRLKELEVAKVSAFDELSNLALMLSVGSGDDDTNAEEYGRRIRKGIELLTQPLEEVARAHWAKDKSTKAGGKE